MLNGRIEKQEGPFWSAEVAVIGAYTQGNSRKDAAAMLADLVEMKVDHQGFKATVIESGPLASNGTAFAVIVTGSDPALLAAQVLRYQREVNRLSLADVAKALGASSRNAYAVYEQGRSEPSVSKYLELLHAVAPDMAMVVEPSDAARFRRRREAWLRVINGLRTQEFRAHGVTAELLKGEPVELLIRVGKTKGVTAHLAWTEATGFIAEGIDPDASSDDVLGRMRKAVGL
ncbi:MAG TPA: helix-turn-helix transcriptional regulator [Kofleriaceae bacterium]|jgi:transcriptional regulator with XRE-family HTH domain